MILCSTQARFVIGHISFHLAPREDNLYYQQSSLIATGRVGAASKGQEGWDKLPGQLCLV